MSKRVKLVLGTFAVTATVVGAVPAVAEGGQGCGVGTRVSFFSSTAGKRAGTGS